MLGHLLFYLVAVTAAANALQSPGKQATRSGVVDRMTRTRPQRRAPAGSVLPPPPTVSQATGDQVYDLYYSGTGLTRQDPGPSVTFGMYAGPRTRTISGTTYTTQQAAIQECSEFAGSYDSFEVYFDNNAQNWRCTGYADATRDVGQFTIVDPSADPVYGYSISTS